MGRRFSCVVVVRWKEIGRVAVAVGTRHASSLQKRDSRKLPGWEPYPPGGRVGVGPVVAVGWAVTAVLLVVLVGLILVPVMLVVTLLWPMAIVLLPIVQVVYGCYAAAETYNGRSFRYRWIADLVDRYQAQT